MAVIYRIRNRKTGKYYIGETKEMDPYTRWKQHLNLIQKGKRCPALRDAIQKHGVEVFEFQIMIFCFDEDRFKYEIDYIARYNTVVPNGYNIAKGGQGGPLFAGKKHTAETIAKIQVSKRKYYDDPEYCKKISERTKKCMESPELRQKLSIALKNSEKFKKAVEEGRVGSGKREYTEELRKKISDSVKEHFARNSPNTVDIENHRKAMAKAVGRKVYQYSAEGKFLKMYDSIKEAARAIQRQHNSIQQALNKPNRKSGGFIWKTTGPNEPT